MPPAASLPRCLDWPCGAMSLRSPRLPGSEEELWVLGATFERPLAAPETTAWLLRALALNPRGVLYPNVAASDPVPRPPRTAARPRPSRTFDGLLRSLGMK